MTRFMRRMTAGWLVAAFVLAAGAPLADARHALFDDVLCVDPGQAPGQSAGIREVDDTSDDGHCAVCHLQRAVRHAAVSAVVMFVAADAVEVLASHSGPRPRTTFVAHFSSRAPPLPQHS